MSDINNGMLRGNDGKLSLRRLAAVILGSIGVALIIINMFRIDIVQVTSFLQLATMLAPGALLILIALFLIGMVTWQMVKELPVFNKENK